MLLYCGSVSTVKATYLAFFFANVDDVTLISMDIFIALSKLIFFELTV